MSWELSLLSTWTSAGGVPVANLGQALDGSIIRRELGSRGVVTLVFDADIAWVSVAPRTIIRVDGLARGGYLELRVASRSRQTRGAQGTRFTVTGHPRIYDLSDSDLVRENLGGRTITRFSEHLTPQQYGDRFLWVIRETDGLTGIRWGTVEFTDKVPLQWDRWTRGELLAGLISATDAEVQWRIAEDGWEEVDLLRRTGADAVPFPLQYGGLLLDHQLDESYDDLMTVARVAGEAPTGESERATIGEAVWRVANVRSLGSGQYAIEVRAPDSEDSPILEDGQYCAHPTLVPPLPARYLARLDGSAPLLIEATSVAASECTVTGTPPVTGERVQFVSDIDGTLLETLELPSAIEAYGSVVRDLQIAGGRGERQYARNGGHEYGIAEWSAVNAGAASEYRRSEFGVTRTALAQGARSAATGTGTPFAIDGLEANSFVRKGMEMRVGGAVLPVTAAVIPSTAGGITAAVGGGGLPGDYPDNAPFTLIRRVVRALTLDGNHSAMLPMFAVTDSNTDNISFQQEQQLVSVAAHATYTLASAALPYRHPMLRAGAAFLESPVFGYRGQMAWPTMGADVTTFTALSIGAGGGGAYIDVEAAPGLVGIGDKLSYRVTTGGFTVTTTDGRKFYPLSWVVSVTTDLGGGLYRCVPDLPNGIASVVCEYPLANFFNRCNVVIAGGTVFTVTTTRDTRVLNGNGALSAGAMSLPLKNDAALATRNWVATDTIELRRDLTATMRVTAVLSATQYVDDDLNPLPGGEYAVTIDLGVSTIDDYTMGVDWNPGDVYFEFDGRSLRLESITGSTAVLSRPTGTVDPGDITVPHTATASWTKYDTYALTGTASWAATGRVILTLASAVPAGRSYGRGAITWANWHTRAAHGLQSQLRLYAALNATDTTVELYGNDYIEGGVVALYRVTTDATFPIPGNTLYAADTVQANGSGEAAVVLTGANPNPIADNEAVTIVTPPLVPITEPQNSSALRLFCPVGGSDPEPLSGTAGQAHSLFYVRIPAGSTRQLTVRSLFTLSAADWFAPQGPVVAIVDAMGTILGWSALGDDGIDVTVAPGIVELTTRAVLSTSGLYGIRVYGGHATDFTKWCLHLRSMAYVGEALDAPYTPEAFPTALMLTALRRLSQQSAPRITDRLTVQELHDSHAQALGISPALLPQLTLGGTVHLEDWDREVRITAIEEQPGMPVAAIEVGQLARDGSQLIGSAAIAAGVRRIR